MSNAMRFGKRTLAGVAAGALALGALTIASAPAASAAPKIKPKAVTGLTATTFVAAATASTPGAATSPRTLPTNLMNLIAITGDDTFAVSPLDDSVVSIRLDSAPADDTGTGFARIQLSADDSSSPASANRIGSGVALNADGAVISGGAPVVNSPNAYFWTRGSVVTLVNQSALAETLILQGTASNAGTYGFTAWVNKGSASFGSLEPGEPFTTGTLTVGGTPTAFAMAPASASVGAGQNATFSVTATDSAGRGTFPTGAAPSTGQFANVTATPTGVSFTNSTPGFTSSSIFTTSLGAAQFINLGIATQPQGTASFLASSVTAGNYAISVTPGGSLPGTVTPAASTLTVSPTVAVSSALVTGPATVSQPTSTANALIYRAPATSVTSSSAYPLYVPTSATALTFRVNAAAGSTAGQLIPYTVTNGSGNTVGTGVASGSFTAAIDANLRASVTLTATGPIAGETTYRVAFGAPGAQVIYDVSYTAPALNINNLTTTPPLGSVSFVQTATAQAITASVTDQFNQPLQNITVRATPSVSAAASATTDATGKATVSIAGPAATVTSQTVTFTLTPPLGSATPASGALTLRYTASGSPTSLTLTSLAGNVTATAAVTQNVDVSGAASGTWAASGNTGWFPVNATIGGAVAGVPVTFSAPDTYFSSAAGATSLTASTVAKNASVGIVSQSTGVATTWVKPTKTGTVTVTANAGGLTQTITWKVANNALTDARVITVTPAKQDASGLAQVTATVTDAFGNAVANASLNFSEQGVGNFAAGTSTLTTATGPSGSVTVDVLSTTAGDSKVTVVGAIASDYSGTANSPAAGAPAGVSSGVADIKFGAAKGITITGSRTTVSGKSGIKVEGVTTGIANGQTVTPFIRFPGETTFTEGSARPVITDGKFTWERKTGKRVTVYVSHDGVNSNRVTIQAS